ncbi:cell envelope integrity protein TolA [Thalassotalea sp. M1531]|uniref:Cell envelope integrity protein TolA n=1 Tax=Thalassotalea algicola TaxID=2716224 RepID=A0A7Y0LE59_9GAMM|nr:cell envelope integrity protein TolA [Thalassotalea algicola]NMP32617.1 cell envelope integrity protein TolA [Thalassotalea algicola]
MLSKLTSPIGLSISLHTVLGIVLFFGNFTSHPPKPTPMQVNLNPIQAVVVDKSIIENHAKKLREEEARKKAAERKRLKAIEDKAAAAKRRKQKEEARIKKLENQRKQREKEKRIADEKARKAKQKAIALEKERKRKEAERKKKAEKAAAEAKKKREREAAEKKRKEAERKRKAKEAKERAQQEKMLAEQMAQEMAARQKARSHQMQTEISRYTALITQTIQRFLITDRSTMEGKSCKLTITLAPSGFVTNVQTGQGSAVVCNAAKNAVYKAGTLPVSKDPEVFRQMQKISLTVIPEF